MRPTRRQALAWLAAAPTLIGAAPALSAQSKLSSDDDAFLDDMQRRGCRFFLEQVGSISGQVLDRARADNSDGKRDPRPMASIACTGFGLTALCIAHQRSYADRPAIREQVVRTLRFHADVLPNVHGFFFHFTDVDSGERWRNTELSSIDTSILLCGVLTARAYFHDDAEIVKLATTIYERVDWPWMLNGGDVFSMGWKPGSGFLKSTWSHYCELMMIPLLALGSPTHPVDPKVWSAWSRPQVNYAGFTYISGHDPLFTHQYSHAWFDFRNRRDDFADYFANSIVATRAHKAFCLSLGKPYSDDLLGDKRFGFSRGLPGVGRTAAAWSHRRLRGA